VIRNAVINIRLASLALECIGWGRFNKELRASSQKLLMRLAFSVVFDQLYVYHTAFITSLELKVLPTMSISEFRAVEELISVTKCRDSCHCFLFKSNSKLTFLLADLRLHDCHKSKAPAVQPRLSRSRLAVMQKQGSLFSWRQCRVLLHAVCPIAHSCSTIPAVGLYARSNSVA